VSQMTTDNHSSFLSSILTYHRVMTKVTRSPPLEQELLTHMSYSPVLVGFLWLNP